MTIVNGIAQGQGGLIKARLGPKGTMVWALRVLQLHQQAEWWGVLRAALNGGHR